MKKENGKAPKKTGASACEKHIARETFVRLQSVYPSLKTAEKKAADFMLANPEKIAENNITEAAVMAGCSEATLIRITKRLNYGSYPELRSSIVGQREAEPGSGGDILYAGLTADDSDRDVVRKVFMASVRAIEDSLDMLDMESYLGAVETIRRAQKVLLVGSGDALAVALSGCFKFARAGIDARCMYDFDSQLVQASQLSENDAVIAISHSGRTGTIHNAVKEAKLRKARIIAITNVPVSPLTKQADIVLLTASFMQNTMGEIMTKRIPELCIIESLYISLVKRNPALASEILKRSDGAIRANKL
ncbi:MAG: MurR/RpiR family transcriptional regulator [Treponema sp.]|jgi:DNA-binding MurR/RpiR family transcriptional regulator|nr:MurR/RpiR family transcriptional regulator [Treponema sp.]